MSIEWWIGGGYIAILAFLILLGPEIPWLNKPPKSRWDR